MLVREEPSIPRVGQFILHGEPVVEELFFRRGIHQTPQVAEVFERSGVADV